MAVLVEHGGGREQSAAPVAGQILARYFGVRAIGPGMTPPRTIRPSSLAAAAARAGGAGLARAAPRRDRLGAMAIDRRLLFNIDWGCWRRRCSSTGIGVATILSATFAGRNSGLEIKQLYAIGLGLVGLLVGVSLDYRRLVDRAPAALPAGGGRARLRALLRARASRAPGAGSWVRAASRSSPREFAKLVAALLRGQALRGVEEGEPRALATSWCRAPRWASWSVLIAAEPDLGTAFTLVPALPDRRLPGRPAHARDRSACVAGHDGRGRPGLDVRAQGLPEVAHLHASSTRASTRAGAGYQKIQSEIAVGSGGLAGKGYKQGTQSQLGYLPARHTDFIFSVLAEENGLRGRGGGARPLHVRPVAGLRDRADGARPRGRVPGRRGGADPAFQVVYNVAMVAGLVPVKGLPLPLMSYGGSSVLSSLFAVGLILNVRMRRFAN